MKPKFRSLIAAFAPLSRTTIMVCASLCAASSAHADQTWTGGADALWTSVNNWSGVALPSNTENAVFDASSIANLTIDTAANQAVGGIVLGSPSGAVTISNNTLTIGTGGIDMSAATQNLTINSGVTAADGGKRLFSVATGRTLTLAAAPTKATVSASPIQVSTTGTTIFGAATTNLLIDTANNPFVTLGTNDWAGLSAGTVVASTYTDATTALVAGVVNDIKASLTGANGTDVAAVRFNESTAYDVTVANSGTARTMTGRGILITANATAGGSIGGNLRNNAFLRPNRTSGNPSFNIINNSTGAFTIGAILGNASSGVAVRLVKTGPGKVISLQDNSYSAGTFIGTGGALQFGDGSAVSGFAGFGFPGGGNIVDNSELIIKRASNVTLVNNISGTGSLTQAGPGELDLTTSVSTFTGAVNITGGSLGVTSMDNLGSGTDINIDNGAAFKFLAAIDPTVRAINIGSTGAAFDSNGLAITLSNAFTSGSTGSVTKTGAGSLELAADNDYSGGTTVAAGTLLIGAGTTSATGSGTVTVDTGATLGGTGSVSGDVVVLGGGKVAPGASVGNLTVPTLNLASGSTGDFEFNGTPSNDTVTVTTSGGLTINGGAISLLQEGSAVAFATPGVYNLISFSGSIGGAGVSSLSVANPQAGFTYAFSDDGSNVILTIGTSGIVSHWITDGGDSWGTGANWDTNPNFPDIAGGTAIFDKVLTGGPAVVTLDGSRTVGAITFLGNPNGYTISAGSGGSLTIDNDGSDGAINNNGGTHEISADIVLTSNLALSSASAAEITTLSGVVSGAGSITKPGPGQLVLSGANSSLSGAVVLTGGTTTFATDGIGTGDLTISGASLVWQAGGNTQDISNRTITFGANPVTFDVSDNNISFANDIGNGGAAAFTKAGSGTLTFELDTTFSGNVTIADGVLQLGTGGSTGNVVGNILNNGGLVINRADDLTFSNVISGTGTLDKQGAGALNLFAANTFSGDTSITGGSIVLYDALALQNSTLQYDSAGGVLSFDLLTAASLGGLNGDLDLDLMNVDAIPAPVALTVGASNASTTYSGILSGTGASLTKVGTGILTLEGIHTYDGITSVTAGEIVLDFGGAIGGSALNTSGTGTMHVVDGDITETAGNLGVGSGGLFMEGGTVAIAGLLNASGSTGSTNSAPIRVYGGALTADSISLGRGGLNATAEPIAAPADTGLYVNGGSVDVTGDLLVGTGNLVPNSSVVTRVDNGVLTVGGAILVGLNNGGRWSILDINGGDLVSTGTAVDKGVVLGGPAVGKSDFLMRSGTATVERIQLGRDTLGGAALINLTGGELYVGSGGIVLGTTEPTFASEIRLNGGTLAAKANWSTSLPINVAGAVESVVLAEDNLATPYNITLNGPLTGAGSLKKLGEGNLTLTGGHSYTGNTLVWYGTLSVTTADFSDTAIVDVELANSAVLNLNFGGGDYVAEFDIDGVAQAPGIYGAIGSGAPNETATITGTGLLYVATALPASGYASWASGAGLTATVNDGATQDPENDGIENVLEFVLGGNPLASDTGILPTLDASGANFVFTFTRADESEAEVTTTFQYGSDLSGWTDVVIGADNAGSGSEANIVEDGANPDQITVTIPKGANTKLFGRIQAVK